MTIASEITALQTNLQAAKDAVIAKGGTVGDTGLAGLAAEIQTIPNGGGSNEPSNGGHITGYDNTTGVITGDGFGTTAGTVYLLDRNTNSYVAQPTSSWSDTSITLTNTIDTSSIEGTTSLSVVDSKGQWATKWLITGGIAVAGWGKVYVQDPATRVIRSIALSSQSDFNQLFSSDANKPSEKSTINGDAFYRDEIVGFQFGADTTAGALNRGSSYCFLSYATNLNQPFVMPSTIDSISGRFGYYWSNFNQPLVISENVTVVPDYFLACMWSFNQPTDLSHIVTIGNYCLQESTAFDQDIDLSSATTIGNSFLAGYIYQTYIHVINTFNGDIKLSDSLTSIGTNFLANNARFNREIKFPASLSSIGNYFLYECDALNKPVDLSSTAITQIPNYFMSYCSAFDSQLTLPNVTSIGNYFLYYGYRFNKALSIPSTVTTIGDYFMAVCDAFNHPFIVPEGVTTIGTNFLSMDYALNNKVTLPSTLTSVGNSLLYNSCSVDSVEINTTTVPSSNTGNMLATIYYSSKMYDKGITLTGTGATAWKAGLANKTSSPYRKLIDGTV